MNHRHNKGVYSVCSGMTYDKDKLFVGDKKVKLFNIKTGETLKEWGGNDTVRSVFLVNMNGNNYLITCCENGKTQIFLVNFK
tara:strand:+ start:436 stop:681 length:246 start_codon:yes stop_codon:yes gene_type:complete